MGAAFAGTCYGGPWSLLKPPTLLAEFGRQYFSELPFEHRLLLLQRYSQRLLSRVMRTAEVQRRLLNEYLQAHTAHSAHADPGQAAPQMLPLDGEILKLQSERFPPSSPAAVPAAVNPDIHALQAHLECLKRRVRSGRKNRIG